MIQYGDNDDEKIEDHRELDDIVFEDIVIDYEDHVLDITPVYLVNQQRHATPSQNPRQKDSKKHRERRRVVYIDDTYSRSRKDLQCYFVIVSYKAGSNTNRNLLVG